MVDVSEKKPTARKATASASVVFPQKVFDALRQQNFSGSKGSIIQTAVIAGIQAAKKTADLIPLCHSLALTKIDINVTPHQNSFHICCRVKCKEATGVEMEALTGASVCALTLYDMCKALSHNIRITDIQLDKKTGGKNDFER